MPPKNFLKTSFISSSSLSSDEQRFFDLDNYPIIDIQSCLIRMKADQGTFYSILQTLITEELPNEKIAYIRAHQQGKWENIEKLAHKMKGGAMYTGLVKLQYACQYFEDYYQNNQPRLLENLYQQIIQVLQETIHSLQQLWDYYHLR